MGRLKREDMVQNYVSQTRTTRYYLLWGIVQLTRPVNIYPSGHTKHQG